MKKILNKISVGILALVMILGAGFLMTACDLFGGGDSPPSNVMTMSLNPSVEFMLDSHNKVVSVSANNDEGHLIISVVDFDGCKAEEAAELFVQACYDYGFALTSSILAGRNNIDIELSFAEDDQVTINVLAAALAKTIELNIPADINFDEITQDEIKELVSECRLDLDEEALAESSFTEMLELLQNSRQATENLPDEHLKDLFYIEEAIIRASAELNFLLETAAANADRLQIVDPMLNLEMVEHGITALQTSMSEVYVSIMSSLQEVFLSAESQLALAKAEYIEAKKEYLEANLFTGVTIVDQTMLEEAEEQYEEAQTVVDELLDEAKTLISEELENIKSMLEFMEGIYKESEYEKELTKKLKNISNEFRSKYSSAIDTYDWSAMMPENAR